MDGWMGRREGWCRSEVNAMRGRASHPSPVMGAKTANMGLRRRKKKAYRGGRGILTGHRRQGFRVTTQHTGNSSDKQ
jgi:hypothetical protein